MFRLILVFLVGYVIWKMVQLAIRIMSNIRPSDRRHVRDERGPEPKQKQEYTNVTDAEFEDLPPTGEDNKDQRTP